jgi:RNA polymerase sigma-70 factor (ECF subfamily)
VLGRKADIPGLYRQHADELLLFLTRRTADVEIALDLWAETFAVAIEAARKFRGTSDAEAAGWLWGIARKQLAMYYRGGRTERAALDRLKLERPQLGPTVEDQIARRADLSTLRSELAAALATLSADTRAAVEMRIVQELPYEAVASRLEISEPAARARVSRGLQAISGALDHTQIKETIQP